MSIEQPSEPKMDLEKIAAGVRLILEGIGEDLSRDGLRETPSRVAEMYTEICGGLHEQPEAEMKVIPAETYDEMVMVKDIAFASICRIRSADTPNSAASSCRVAA